MSEVLQSLVAWTAEHWLALLGALLAITWVILEYRASMWLWPVGVVLPLFYIVISWEARFLGNIAINVYYLVASIVGWIVWMRGTGGQEKPITHASRPWLLWGSVSVVLGAIPLHILMRAHSALPWADALSTSASVLGMIWLGRKHLEHWCCWLVANLTGFLVFLWARDYISAGVFAINFGMSIAGYRHWRRQMAQPALSSRATKS